MASSGGEGIKFSVVVSMLESMQRSKGKKKPKQTYFRKFLNIYCGKPQDYFASMRLILPGLDRDRGSYGLKEQVLATCIIDAIGMSRDSDDARLLLNWRKAGPRAGLNAGNFSLVAAEEFGNLLIHFVQEILVLERRQGVSSAGLTIKELNHFLDSLASSANRSEKTAILSDLIRRTNANEMKWIVMIILKDLKVGISEKIIFREFHPDAEDLFNVTCDLKLVCEKLRDRNQRHKRQDIEVGKAVRPQLARRANTVDVAWKRLRGKEFVLECKFDGDRIQIHKNKDEIHFFSRNFFDHQEYVHGMSEIIVQNILVEKCILDGEMLVWDRSANRFAEFGSNQEIAKAAREGLDSDRQLCYVAFDVLYAGDTSVIHQSLKERHELLRKVVKPVKGSLEILVPNGGLNVHRAPGEPCWSFIGHSLDDIEKFFKATTENRDEGIILKDLNSKWDPGDRKGNWQKMKPDYVRPETDLDVLIIGGYYGSGRHGGKVAQFLVGLSERPSPGTYPRRFLSFCRVGTGLSDEELDAVVTRLKPYFRKYEFPKQTPPSFYQVTNNSKERPDVWVESPEKSIIVSITSDIRTISSEVYAAPYSLRFPRIDCVRYDKPWHDCLDVQSFVELVNSSNGTTQRGTNSGGAKGPGSKNIKLKSRERKNASLVPSHFVQTDVSQIKGETSIFSNMVFYFANVPSSHTLDFLHKMIVEHGGTFSMNMNNSVTHCIAAESRGIKFQAAKLQGDVIHCSWLFDCCSQKRLLPLLPKCFIFLSDSTKKKLQEEVDEFSDTYYIFLKMDDFKQLMNSFSHSEESKVIELYKKKYCPEDKWCRFHDCCIHFFLPTHSLNGSQQKVYLELAMRRLKLEVTMGGGKFSDNILQATHLVIITLPELCLNFDMLLKSFSAADRHLLCSNNLHIVSSQWLEDCCEKDQKLPEDSYSLKPMNFEAYAMKERKDESTIDDNMDKHVLPAPPFVDKPEEKTASLNESTTSVLPKRDVKRKQRPRVRTTSTRPEAAVKQPRRAKFGSKPARIDMIETSESDDSSVGISQKHGFCGSDKEENCDFDMRVDDSRKPMIDRDETKTRQKLTVRQPRRAMVGSKSAKIKENETDESDDDALVGNSQKHEFGRAGEEETCDFDMHNDESRKPKIDVNETTRQKLTVKQPRRAKVGSKSAKISENESNDSDGTSVGISQKHEFGMSNKGENHEFDMHNDATVHKSCPEIPLRSEIDDSKMLTQGKETKESFDYKRDGEERNVSRTLDHKTHHDPFQSILQPNMLPCHEKKPSSSTTPLECENQVPSLDTKPNNSMDVDTHENPSKKKKVSFKSLAAELLKDW